MHLVVCADSEECRTHMELKSYSDFSNERCTAMRRGSFVSPILESLEDRNCPSNLSFFFDGAGNLTITGNPDNVAGGLTVAVSAPNLVSVFDAFPPAPADLVLGPVPVSGNLMVRTGGLDDLVTVALNVGSSLNGNLMIDTGTGMDTAVILGTPGSTIGGDVWLSNINGMGNLVASTGGGPFVIGGSLRVNSAFENNDLFFNVSSVLVGRDVSILTGNGGDVITFGGATIGGSVSAQLGNALSPQSFTLSNTSVGGRLTYQGGNGDDEAVSLTGSTIGGSALVNLFGTFGINSFSFDGASAIGGGLTLFGGSGTDQINTFAGTLAGNLFASLGGGDNDLNLTGSSLLGSSITYFGGAGTDDLTFAPTTAPLTRLFASLGAGTDSFALDTSGLMSLFIDFGADTDTFTQMVPLPMLASLLNL